MAIALLVKELMILLREAKCNFIEQNCYILLVFKKKKNDLGGGTLPPWSNYASIPVWWEDL